MKKKATFNPVETPDLKPLEEKPLTKRFENLTAMIVVIVVLGLVSTALILILKDKKGDIPAVPTGPKYDVDVQGAVWKEITINPESIKCPKCGKQMYLNMWGQILVAHCRHCNKYYMPKEFVDKLRTPAKPVENPQPRPQP